MACISSYIYFGALMLFAIRDRASYAAEHNDTVLVYGIIMLILMVTASLLISVAPRVAKEKPRVGLLTSYNYSQK